MDITTRPVEERDARAIVALLNPIIEAGTYAAMTGPVSVRDQLDFIRAFPERGV